MALMSLAGTNAVNNPLIMDQGSFWDQAKNWGQNTPWFQQPIMDEFTGAPTGKMSGSIMGDLSSVGGGLLDIGKLGMGWMAAKQAKDALKFNKAATRAGMQFGVDQYNDSMIRRAAQQNANTGMSGIDANKKAQSETSLKSLASYGL
jgi:hypothetical protein